MNWLRVAPSCPLRYAVKRLDRPPTRLVASIFCSTGSPIRDSLRCSKSMKLGIHSAPDWVRIGSTAGVVDHQLDELFDGFARGFSRSQGLHGPRADIVIDGTHEFVTVGKAFVEVAFRERGLAAHRTDGQRGPTLTAEQLHAGGDEIVAAEGEGALPGDAGPTAPALTGLHIAPKLQSDNARSHKC